MWNEAMLRSITEDLGTMEKWEITKAHAKMRVHVNGLLPLLKTYTLEFANGDEVVATLVYEKLEKHCSHCSMLDHEKEECPELTKGEEETGKLPPLPQRRGTGTSICNISSGVKRKRDEIVYPLKEERRLIPGIKGTVVKDRSKSRYSCNHTGSRGSYLGNRPSHHGQEQRWVETGRRISNSVLADSAIRDIGVEKSPEPYRGNQRSENRSLQREQGRRSPVESSHSRRSNRSEELRTPRAVLPTEALREARGEVREVMAQYANCADPNESAARKERLRIAEERGEVDQTAEQMVRHSIRAQTQIQEEEMLEPLMHERVHATLRLGPVLTEIPITEEPPRIPAKKHAPRAASLQHSPCNLEEEDGFSESVPSSTLKILSWNCRGLGNPGAVRSLQEIKKKHDFPEIIFLMETKNGNSFVLKELKQLNYDYLEMVPPYARGGGLALLWKKEVEVNILHKCDNFIDSEVRFKGEKFYATFVYGDPKRDGRAEIWRAIRERAENREAPWFLTGDFNEILDNSEKQGGPARTEGSFVEFRSFMSECDLFDLRFSGNFLSWRGKRRNHLVRCRLDRAMANSYWIEAYPSGRSEYLKFEGSDHRPLITTFQAVKKRKKGLFRYDRSLRNNEEVKALIEECWNTNPRADVEMRISNCRKAIIQWHRNHHRNSQQQIEEKRRELEEAMTSNESNDIIIRQINKKLKGAYEAEEEYWRQRSKQMWLSLGDKNSGYFHAATRGRRARNNISVIEDDEGKTVYEEAKIAEVITKYFEKMFTSQAGSRAETVNQGITPSISEETNRRLIQIPSPQEVNAAIFLIHPDKAPGPDGFSASFFHSNWGTIGERITLEIQEAFRSGVFPQNINATHICLIPKKTNPKSVADYRPIALCNVYYKIFSNIITARLQPILDGLISENQSAFVPGRAIADNVMITHEILHFLKISKANKRGSMTIKTDMTKAYDRVEWDFIRLVLEKMGFHSILIGWIMQCVTSVTFKFLLNGTAIGNVKPTRGIRQGDPLSPYLFILCSEVLSGLCNKAQETGQLSGIRVANGSPKVNHLLFADDTMFFCKSNEKTCKALKEILRKYEEASGQMISCQKSAITFSSKTSNEIKRKAMRILGIQQEGGKGKYLGLPEAFGRKKKDLLNSVVDRIRQRAISWSSKLLSSAGKLVMLKSVLSSMPTYSMSCFKIPVSLSKRIQSVLTRFWWDANPEKKKMCWVAWNKLTRGKRDGGLGIRDIQDFNDALLSKLSWRILKNLECLLARILKGKYFPNQPFLDCAMTEGGSHGWRGIMIGQRLLKEKLGKVIGNGETTSVCGDPWLSTKEPIIPVGPAPREFKDLKVKDLFLPNSRVWNVNLIRRVLPAYEKEILGIIPGIYVTEDRLAWLPQTNGEYSVKTGYHTARERNPEEAAFNPANGNFNWVTDIWKGLYAPKLKLFIWKSVKGALPVVENLAARGMIVQSKCIHCGEPETTLHLLFHCRFAQVVWNEAPFREPFSPRAITSVKEGISKLKTIVCLPPLGIKGESLAPWILWSIWLSRNNKLFNASNLSAYGTLNLAIIRAREWIQAQNETALPHPLPKRDTRVNLPGHYVRCQTDGAWNGEHRSGGTAWIFHKSTSETLNQGFKAFANIASPLIAEGLAIRQALRQALDLGFNNLHVASDSQQLITAINSKSCLSEIFGILQDISFLSSCFNSVIFGSIPRSENIVADALAKRSLQSLLLGE
ncbi:unnamed protein product [Microthlaspi erraticum]|uniref:Reverse transcriptase domain-containing protein n=1 Tax=Microthlaspi erraticum TaxID=1685480 RepID=A0A6D2JRW3_9BRAS|nr:unnamed protein product [Microthlaspi erraticum]CAA7044455.1 unnamed protein product [Microthlaspi erraticum]